MNQATAAMRRIFLCCTVLLLSRSDAVSADGTTTRGLAAQRRENQISARIVGGNTARSGRYPYAQISLATAQGLHQCGGSLIAPDVILTAGHCHSFFTQIRVNIYNVKSETESYEVYNAQRMHFHPLFDELWFRYDFLLLKLDRPVTVIDPVRLNDDNNFPTIGYPLTVVGWGLTDPDDLAAYPEVLKEVEVSYISNEMCETTQSKGARLYNGYIFNDMMCAMEDGKDACSGDSGAPLIRRGSTYEEDVVVAVVSWGNGCATDYPGVYARISYQYDWIKEVVCAISVDPPSYFDCIIPTSGNINNNIDNNHNNINNNQNHNIQSETVEPPVIEDHVDGDIEDPIRVPGGYVPIKVEIQLDQRSKETGWALVANNGTVVEEVKAGTYTTPYDLVEKTLVLPASSQFTFVITDSDGNGICCDFGGGWFQVSTLLADNSARPLVRGYGTFLLSSTNVFVTPLDNTPVLGLKGQGQSQLEGVPPCTTIGRVGNSSDGGIPGCLDNVLEINHQQTSSSSTVSTRSLALGTSLFLIALLR